MKPLYREALRVIVGPAYCPTCLNHVESFLHYELCVIGTPKENM